MGETKERRRKKKQRKLYMEETVAAAAAACSNSSSSCSFIPIEVLLGHIFPRLPTKSLIRCRSVCKLWFTTILLDDPQFAFTQFLLYSLKNPRLLFKFALNYDSDSLEDTYLVRHAKNHCYHLLPGGEEFQKADVDGGGGCNADGSSSSSPVMDSFHKIGIIQSKYRRDLVGFCNGLICLLKVQDRTIEVCNPTRREIMGIFFPRLFIYHESICWYGFGFDSLTNEYKLVFVFDKFRCMIYTMGTNSSWREITITADVLTRLPTLASPDIMESKSSIFCNGFLYWRTSKKPGKLVSFNLHEEKFQVIQIPAGVKRCQLLELKGSLCVGHFRIFGKHKTEVYLHTLTTKDNNIDEQEVAWAKETFVLDFSPRFTPSLVSFSDQVLLHWFEKRFIIYNVHTKVRKEIQRPRGLPRRLRSSVSCIVENVSSLQSFMQEGTPKILNCYPSLEFIKNLKQERHKKPGVAYLFVSSRNIEEEIRTDFYL